MTTADGLVTDAVALVLSDEENISLEPQVAAIGRRFLNDLCAEWELGGTYLNYTPVVSASDLITCPSGAISGLKHGLAERIAPILSAPISDDLRANIRSSVQALKSNFVRPIVSNYPGTLPRGAGNRWRNTSRFTYTEPEVRGELTRTSQAVTITTIDTPVRIGGWTVAWDYAFTASDTSLTYNIDGQRLGLIEAHLTTLTAGSENFTFYVYKNSAQLAPGVPVTADETRNVFVQRAEPMVKNDVFELYVENNSGTENITIQGTFTIT